MSPYELIAELILMPLIAFVVGAMMVLMMRRIAAKLQRRVGPPLFQAFSSWPWAATSRRRPCCRCRA